MPKRKSPQPHSRSKAAAPCPRRRGRRPAGRRPSARARSVSASMIRHMSSHAARVWIGYGQVESCGQPQLGDEGLGLLGDEGVAPIVGPARFRRSRRSGCLRAGRAGKRFHAGQLFAPGGVVVDRRGVQPDHREAVFGVAAAEVEEPAVARGVDGGQQQRRDAGLAGPCDSRFAVVVKLRFVEVRVGIDQFHRARFIGFVEFPSSFSRLGKARTSSALLSAYRKRS